MASIRPCNKCGERISIRQMPHQQWVAFDVATDNPHKCSRKKTKQKKSEKSVYSGISLTKEIEKSNEDYHFEDDAFENEIEEIENLKSLKKDKYSVEEKLKEDPFLRWAFSKNIFSNPLVMAIIIVILLSIFLYPSL